jgi:hypothetical protein
VYSGKITVMGVLESRGIQYDGVIIVDFNEGIVPNINSKDLFLNSAIRKKAHLPTRNDKENLQKHYYFSLINSSKKVALSYVHNEKESVSRFLYELGFEIGENQDKKYNEVLYKFSNKKELPTYEESFEIKQPLFPTTLKTLLECPQKYYFSKILNIKDEEEKGENFGSVFHTAVETVVKNKDLINSETEYFEKLMSEIFSHLNSKKDIFEIRTKFEDSIREFCKLDFEQMKYSKNMCEVKVEFPFENFKLGARIDRIDITETKITLIDYKTSKSLLKNTIKYPLDFQLTFYYIFGKLNYPNKKIVTAFWDIYKAEFIEIEPRIEDLKESLKTLPTTTIKAEDIIIDGKTVKKANSICEYCDYKIGCGR